VAVVEVVASSDHLLDLVRDMADIETSPTE
jgi:hypothetical protein